MRSATLRSLESGVLAREMTIWNVVPGMPAYSSGRLVNRFCSASAAKNAPFAGRTAREVGQHCSVISTFLPRIQVIAELRRLEAVDDDVYVPVAGSSRVNDSGLVPVSTNWISLRLDRAARVYRSGCGVPVSCCGIDEDLDDLTRGAIEVNSSSTRPAGTVPTPFTIGGVQPVSAGSDRTARSTGARTCCRRELHGLCDVDCTLSALKSWKPCV